ncbi:cytochrome C oxidase subunit III [Saccharobesus litoralis]|uniref:Cytochrome C oxidase subunit III n=1 Tax=Saccharobesus litoralis TaxID=2172099 RepID=A0A2S0VN30_9ALTE|nr:cytochrome c oxidase subunit 3 family protein [Saccharobesus litoralis]AWB65615.1 cytochrome C oxidase subunit III [Saccharobesus litoralis]
MNSEAIAVSVSAAAQNKTKHTPGSIAIWILIAAELTEFAFFFIAFLIAKLHYPQQFAQGPSQLNTFAGTWNTLLLLSSSFFVAKAMTAVKSNYKRRALRWLGLTIVAGASYCGVKIWEYFWNQSQAIHSTTDTFFALYYYLTFNHLLHVVMGMCSLFCVGLHYYFDGYNAEQHQGLDSAASYWHMIDLVWIIMFPLLYIVS